MVARYIEDKMGDKNPGCLKNTRLTADILGDVVRVEIRFSDAYAARVYFEDLFEQMHSGQGVRLDFHWPQTEDVSL